MSDDKQVQAGEPAVRVPLTDRDREPLGNGLAAVILREYPQLREAVRDVLDRLYMPDAAQPAPPVARPQLHRECAMFPPEDRCGECRPATPPAAARVPLFDCHVAKIDHRWDGERQHHVPTLLIEFEPVPVNAGGHAKGWQDRDAMAQALKSGCAARVPLTPAQVHADELLEVLKAGRDDLALAAACWNEDENRQLADFHRERVLSIIKRVDDVIAKAAGQEGGAA